MKKHIPNSLTMLNLLCGTAGIVACFSGNIILVPWLMTVALIADFLDGYVARLLGVKSELGKQLDSLADMVTFGVLPGMILLFFFSQENGFGAFDLTVPSIGLLAFLYPIFAALRLGKFNIDDRQTVNFIGMPTPAGGLFVMGILLVFLNDNYGLRSLVTDPLFLSVCSVVLSLLMVSPIPMFSLKANIKTFRGNEIRYMFMAVSAGLLVFFGELALPVIIALYVLVGLVSYLLKKEI